MEKMCIRDSLLEDDKNNNHSVTQNSGENMSSVYQRFAGDLRETPLYVEKKIREMYPEARTLYEALKEYAPECRITRAQGISYTGNNTAGYEEALNLAAKADVILSLIHI